MVTISDDTHAWINDFLERVSRLNQSQSELAHEAKELKELIEIFVINALKDEK